MLPAPSHSSAPCEPLAGVPRRSPRSSIILAELTRARRLERRQHRLKRQQRRQAWNQVRPWLAGLGPWAAVSGTLVVAFA